MSSKKANDIPADKLSLYDKLIATNPNIERKGNANPYTSHNGHMFTFLSANGVLAIRLPEKDRELFIKKYKTGLMIAYGIVMKEYVEVPGNLLKKTNQLKTYLDMSYDYIKTLKPKPTKKSKL
jgi:hypothetical protein